MLAAVPIGVKLPGPWVRGTRPGGMWWWVGAFVLAAACARAPGERGAPPPAEPAAAADPLAAGFASLGTRRFDEAARRFTAAGERHPALLDYALYFEARAAARAGHRDRARETLARLLREQPD